MQNRTITFDPLDDHPQVHEAKQRHAEAYADRERLVGSLRQALDDLGILERKQNTGTLRSDELPRLGELKKAVNELTEDVAVARKSEEETRTKLDEVRRAVRSDLLGSGPVAKAIRSTRRRVSEAARAFAEAQREAIEIENALLASNLCQFSGPHGDVPLVGLTLGVGSVQNAQSRLLAGLAQLEAIVTD